MNKQVFLWFLNLNLSMQIYLGLDSKFYINPWTFKLQCTRILDSERNDEHVMIYVLL